MAKSDYIPDADDALLLQMQAFGAALPSYATTFGITAGQVAAHIADTDYFEYVIQCRNVMRNTTQQWTAWKNTLRNGGTGSVLSAPADLALPTAVPAVEPGIEERFRALCSQIKRHAAYDNSVGEGLGIVGPEETPKDPSTLQPELKLKSSGGAVNVLWSWNGDRGQVDQVEIEVDRDGTGWKMLAIDTTPNYVDTQPFPTTPAKWKYRAIWRKSDQRIGQWSAEVSVQVGA